ncbi:hypothetical protein ACFQ48_21080 [Hymenobacter caeli]|uniref:DUF2784 family protein n=1 Tax=Hymenobacter caeli TaxID=2735894 RepID=A0ABX2FSM4_9BACT|nr:hypothetical protein [Hymenobacter caeli]NRT20185.1 hypothetical protein [Hymenobacter caeli]
MSSARKLLLIKLLHTAVWAFFVAAIVYILYSGLADRLTLYTGVATGLVAGEGLVLALFDRHCPLTVLARRYSDSTKDNFDIFLPNRLARHNQLIFTVLYAVGVGLVVYRLVT